MPTVALLDGMKAAEVQPATAIAANRAASTIRFMLLEACLVDTDLLAAHRGRYLYRGELHKSHQVWWPFTFFRPRFERSGAHISLKWNGFAFQGQRDISCFFMNFI